MDCERRPAYERRDEVKTGMLRKLDTLVAVIRRDYSFLTDEESNELILILARVRARISKGETKK